jgi:hypothetical protein
MALNEAEAATLAEQKLYGEAGSVLKEFIAAGGEETAPYFTANVFAANVKMLAAWCIENLPYGLESCKTIGAWQLSFRFNKDSLIKDESYIGARGLRGLFTNLYNSLKSSQVRAIAENRMGDLNDWNGVGKLTMEQSNNLAQIGGASQFRAFYEESVR